MKNSEIEDLKNRLAKAEAAANKQQKVNKLHLGQSTNRRGKSLTGWESETILMNKQLEDEVKTLELQKLYMQRDLDRHLELAKEEKENTDRTLEELQRELGEAQGEAVKNKEQLDSALAEIKLLKTEKEEGLDTISSEFDELRIEVESLRDTNIEVQSVISDSIQAISLAYMFLQEFSGNVVDIKVELYRMDIMGRLSECTQDLKEGNGRKSAIVEILSHRVVEDIANVKELEMSTASDQLPTGSWAEEKRHLEDVHTQTLIKLQAAEKEIKSHRYDLDAVCKSLELCKSEKKEAEEKIRQLEFFLGQKVEELNESANVHGSACDYFLKMTDELDKKIEEQNASLNKHKSTCEALLKRMDDLEKDVQASLAQKIEEHKMLIGNHENDCTALRKKIEDLGKEKAAMADQISDGHKKQEELKIAIEHAKNIQEEQGKTYIAEKTQLMAEVSSLRKEVAKSASSAVTKEREILRKELEKTKLRLKDTEAKLRNILQDKSKLEAEKANIDREIKLLRAQSSLLQRDISKRESLADKRRESRALDLSRTKNQHDFFEQSLQLKTMELERANFDLEILQEKYKNVERTLFEVQEKLAASEGELFVASEERETLTSELELLSEKLKVTSSELESLHEKHALLNQQLHERGNICSDLEESLSATLKENEEIALQLADVFLQLEEEKAICSSQEKVTMEALEEKRKLSMVNAELKMELESSNDQFKHLSEQLYLVAEKSQEERRVSSLELDQLREELHHSVAEHEISENTMRSIIEDLKSRVEVHSLENEKLSGEIVALRNELERVTREGDEICKQFSELSLKLEEVGVEKLAACSEQAILKDRYSEIQCKLISATDLVEALTERTVILERELDNEKIHFIKETSKLRFALRIARAKLDAFRGRYEEVLNELEEMHRKFMEDSRKLKEQLVAARLESFELKKKLMAVE